MSLPSIKSDIKRARQNFAPDVRRLHMIFRGEVQGVGFRWNAQRCANRLGLVGWVKNEADGSVSMELQGSPDTLACFFTKFNEAYKRYKISYVIDVKEDIEPLFSENDFRVIFG